MSDLELLGRRAWLLSTGFALLSGHALGQAPPPSCTRISIAPEAVPATRQLRYRVRGTLGFLPLFADGDLFWRHKKGSYEARLVVDAGLLGARVRISTGTITPEGLQPLRYTDRSRNDRDTEFDWPRAEARLGRGGTTPLTAGTQDLVSLYIQLACLFAADAASPGLPVNVPLPLAVLGNGKAVEHWRLLIQGEETLDLPGGKLLTRKLLRLPEPGDDLGAEL
ncbi:DUF3108 domain-containing protein, partial [Leptospira sp. SA-E8]|uniref:hypothetical protein n=1 Tax=Leptospira sp. SA-E8 TaxID=3422259 RepID=UPI003EC12E52